MFHFRFYSVYHLNMLVQWCLPGKCADGSLWCSLPGRCSGAYDVVHLVNVLVLVYAVVYLADVLVLVYDVLSTWQIFWCLWCCPPGICSSVYDVVHQANVLMLVYAVVSLAFVLVPMMLSTWQMFWCLSMMWSTWEMFWCLSMMCCLPGICSGACLWCVVYLANVLVLVYDVLSTWQMFWYLPMLLSTWQMFWCFSMMCCPPSKCSGACLWCAVYLAGVLVLVCDVLSTWQMFWCLSMICCLPGRCSGACLWAGCPPAGWPAATGRRGRDRPQYTSSSSLQPKETFEVLKKQEFSSRINNVRQHTVNSEVIVIAIKRLLKMRRRKK